jgi:hypothetical protein
MHINFRLVLHSQHKLDCFRNAGWDEDWITAAQKIVEDEYKRSYASRDIILNGLLVIDATGQQRQLT